MSVCLLTNMFDWHIFIMHLKPCAHMYCLYLAEKTTVLSYFNKIMRLLCILLEMIQ